MRICSLGSGSKGNATVIQTDQGSIVVDCGFGLKECISRLESKGISLADLGAILVSHEHSDHGKGVGMLARKAEVPVYSSAGTYRALVERQILTEHIPVNILKAEQWFDLLGLKVLPLIVPHDATETFQFIFEYGEKRFGILTDTGCITPHLVEMYRDCDYLLMEFNHDLDMLWSGPYPPSLKNRVAGDLGHLSNDQAIEFLKALGDRLPSRLFVSHVSEQNNDRQLIDTLLNEHFSPEDGQVVFACQSLGFDWLHC